MWTARILWNNWYGEVDNLMLIRTSLICLTLLWMYFTNIFLQIQFLYFFNCRCSFGTWRAIGKIHANGRIGCLFIRILNGGQCNWSLLQTWRLGFRVSDTFENRNVITENFEIISNEIPEWVIVHNHYFSLLFHPAMSVWIFQFKKGLMRHAVRFSILNTMTSQIWNDC